MFEFIKNLFKSFLKESKAPESYSETPEQEYKRKRDNAIIYTAMQAGRASLQHFDNVGAILDTVKTLKQYGWNPMWLDPMAVDAMRTKDGKGFVEGFSCDEEAAKEWLKTNSVSLEKENE